MESLPDLSDVFFSPADPDFFVELPPPLLDVEEAELFFVDEEDRVDAALCGRPPFVMRALLVRLFVSSKEMAGTSSNFDGLKNCVGQTAQQGSMLSTSAPDVPSVFVYLGNFRTRLCILANARLANSFSSAEICSSDNPSSNVSGHTRQHEFNLDFSIAAKSNFCFG